MRSLLADTARWLTVPQVARRLAVNPEKIRAWLRSRQLAGVNIALSPHGRPRWRISEKALSDFLAMRQGQPSTAGQSKGRRRAASNGTIEFF
jgi:hypothetical protein